MEHKEYIHTHIRIKGGTITGVSPLRMALEGKYLDINFLRHTGMDLDLTWVGTDRKFKREWYTDENGKTMVREVEAEW